MNDLISRQAAIDYCYALINAENPSDPSDEWNYSQERINQTEVILHHLEFMPSAQPTVYGYSIEYLKMLAIIMQRNNVTPQEANDIMKDMQRVVEMVNEEYEKMLNRSMESVFGKLGGADDGVEPEMITHQEARQRIEDATEPVKTH